MPSRPAVVQSAIDRVLMDVDALPDAALRALYPQLRAAVVDAGQELQGWLKSKKGGDRFTPALRRQALVKMHAALGRIEKRLPAKVLAALKVGGNEAGVAAVRHFGLVDKASRAAFADFKDVGPIPIREAAVVAQGRHELVKRHESSAKRYAGDISRDIRAQITRGMLAGETVDQMTRRLSALGGPRGLVSMGGGRLEDIPEGLFRRYRHWGERLVRTEVMHAYNVQAGIALREAEKDDPGYLRIWDASRDRRTCPICYGLDGKTAKLDGAFPGGYLRPPAHPYCRCVQLPHRKEWEAGVDLTPEASTAEAARRAEAARAQQARAEALRAAEAARRAEAARVEALRAADEARKAEVARVEAAKRAAEASRRAPPPPVPAGRGARTAAAIRDDLLRALERTSAIANSSATGEAKREAGADVRRVLRELVGRQGLETPNRPGMLYRHNPAPEEIGRSAGFHDWDGVVVVAPGEHARAITALKKHRGDVALGSLDSPKAILDMDGLHTLIHEEMHGFGPGGMGSSYYGTGAIIEEVTTELAARHVMREEFGQVVVGAYSKLINHVRGAYSKATGADAFEAGEALTRASLKMKRVTKQARYPDELLAEFTDALGLEGEAASAFDDAIHLNRPSVKD